MKLLVPNSRDIADVGLAIASFDGAFGSIDIDGQYEPSIDEHQLWLMLPVTQEQMRSLWAYSKISTDKDSSYQAMLDGHDHTVDVRAYKVRIGLFSSAWFGNVFLHLSHSELYVGAAVGRYQSEMWEHVRQFLREGRELQDDTAAAIAAV